MSSSVKPKLIIILSRFPFPLEKGDKLRAYYQIIEFSKTYDITLICISDHEIPSESKDELSKFCSRIEVFVLPKWKSLINSFFALLGKKPVQVGYFFSHSIKGKIHKILSDEKPNHIYCQLIRASEYVKDYHNCPKTIDYMDAFSVGIERRIKLEPVYLKWFFKLEASRLKRYEREVYDYFELHTIISEQDARILGTTVNQNLMCVPNGVSLDFLNYNTQIPAAFDIVFVGNLNYPPNVEAVKYIVNEILPTARKKGNNWSFLAAGAAPSKELIQLLKKNEATELRSNIDDIREGYCAGRVFVAPMKIGTGLQNKLLEAMALGLPCITTKLANNALKAENKKEILLAESPEEFVQAIEKLLSSPANEQFGNNGKLFIENQFNWAQSIGELINSMQKA